MRVEQEMQVIHGDALVLAIPPLLPIDAGFRLQLSVWNRWLREWSAFCLWGMRSHVHVRASVCRRMDRRVIWRTLAAADPLFPLVGCELLEQSRDLQRFVLLNKEQVKVK